MQRKNGADTLLISWIGCTGPICCPLPAFTARRRLSPGCALNPVRSSKPQIPVRVHLGHTSVAWMSVALRNVFEFVLHSQQYAADFPVLLPLFPHSKRLCGRIRHGTGWCLLVSRVSCPVSTSPALSLYCLPPGSFPQLPSTSGIQPRPAASRSRY